MSNKTVDYLQTFVATFTWLYIAIIVAWMLSTWVRLPYNVWTNRLRTFLDETASPLVGVFRRFVPRIGMLDLSALFALIALQIGARIIESILGGFRPG
jgi:YggT family protein